jgi:hypothetical protein
MRGADLLELTEAKGKKGDDTSLAGVVAKIETFAKTQGGVAKAYRDRLDKAAPSATQEQRDRVKRLQAAMAQMDGLFGQIRTEAGSMR